MNNYEASKLKKGTKLLCVKSATNFVLVLNKVYTLDYFSDGCFYLEELTEPNNGWYVHRFIPAKRKIG